MRTFYFLLIIAMTCGTATAKEKIEGAFGLKLGEVLDVNSESVSKVDGFENAMYRVEPPNPLDGFDHYMVYVTPQTHTIYQISAFDHVTLARHAKQKFNSLKRVLEKKYSDGKYNAHSHVKPAGGDIFSVDGRIVSINSFSGKDVAEIKKIGGVIPSPRVVVTYRSEHIKLRNKEYDAIHKAGSNGRNISQSEWEDCTSSAKVRHIVC